MNSYGEVATKVPKFGTTRLKSLLSIIPRTRSQPGVDTFLIHSDDAAWLPELRILLVSIVHIIFV